jgi:hypothetical protein
MKGGRILEREILVRQEERESLNNKKTKDPKQNKILRVLGNVFVQGFFIFLGVFLGYLSTEYYDNRQDKEMLISQLESAINISQLTIDTVDMRMKDAEAYISDYSKNKKGDDVTVEDFAIYEPVNYFDYSDSLFKDPVLYQKLTKESQVNLLEINANNKTILSYYDTTNNDYYNYLSLKHLKNNLLWQKNHLQYEYDYQTKKHSGINLDKIKAKYDRDYKSIEGEWLNYTNEKREKSGFN